MTKLKVIFVVGAAANKDEENIVNNESITYHDIVQTDFVDTYKNLSYKVFLYYLLRLLFQALALEPK